MTKYYVAALLTLLACGSINAQKTVQALQPAKLSVFKNGTYFIKREANVNVNNRTFYIPAPENVLMGTYWLAVGKEAGLHSIAIRKDTFSIQRLMKERADYLQNSIGKDIVLYRYTSTSDVNRVSGKLLSYDRENNLLRLQTADKKVILTNSELYNQIETADNGETRYTTDSIAATAKVTVNNTVNQTTASTISLEKGIQWFPSYLLRIVNDKEAQLEMKATLVNASGYSITAPVDIIIGNPEMFFGNQLDPACLSYLSEELTGRRYIDNFSQVNVQQSFANSVNYYARDEESYDRGNTEDKGGEQFEDLYYYKLGVHNLEKDARVIVPVLNTPVTYKDVYTAELTVSSTSASDDKPLQAYHSYRITNNTAAPFTTGAILVTNPAGQPVAQTRLLYTPIKGSTEVRLSKALNVQLKNDEEETKREKSALTTAYDVVKNKISYRGTINIVNYQNKKITIRIDKAINGVVVKMSDGGKVRKVTNADDEDDTVSSIRWEVEIEAGGKKAITYDYYNYKTVE